MNKSKHVKDAVTTDSTTADETPMDTDVTEGAAPAGDGATGTPADTAENPPATKAPGKGWSSFSPNPGFYVVSCALLAMEMVFKVATGGGFWPSIAFIALFSVCTGQLVEAVASLFPRLTQVRVVRIVALALAAVVFGVEYFVFREFKVYYDVKTVIGGAGGVASQFVGDALELIFSPAGILCLVLFLAPPVGYLVFAIRHRKDAAHSGPKKALASLVACAASFALAMGLLSLTGTWGLTYSQRYNFQQAVDDFGLLTAIRKDVQYGGSDSISFVSEDGASPGGTSEDDSASAVDDDSASEEAPVYAPAQMDIDFDSLDQSNTTLTSLDSYVQSLTPSMENEMTGRFEGYNLIFISAEAFTAEAIREDTTPTLWRMATRGINFTDYYQPAGAGTTGGECQNIFGVLAARGGASVKGTATYNNYFTMGNALNRLGYNGWAFHNNTYTYYDRNLTHNNLGYNNGYMGYGNGMEQYVTWQWPQSDLEMVQGTFDNIYGSQEPFNVYYMSVSGHSGYSQNGNAMSRKNWDVVADLDYSDPVRAYLAANVELDRAMEYLIGRLEEEGIADHTVIVISADHFPYGLDSDASLGNMPYLSELYGYNVQDAWQRDHNRLIIWGGSLEDEEPIVVDEPTSSLDVLPTLLNLFGCEWDSRLLPGRDVFSDATPLVFTLSYSWKTDLGTYTGGTFTPNEGAEVPEGYVDSMNAIVANKISYCRGVLENDYFAHIFGPAQDVQEVHDAAAAAREAQDGAENDGEDQSSSAER